MNRAEFVAEAPKYYALAIVTAIDSLDVQATTQSRIRSRFQELAANFTIKLLDRDCIWNAAIDLLEREELLELKKSSFGEPVVLVDDNFGARFEHIDILGPPFETFWLLERDINWLGKALLQIEKAFASLNIVNDDFNSDTGDWEPIEIDSSEPAVQAAIARLDVAVEKIRGDNGYAANYPEERNHVVSGLEATVEKLRSGSITSGAIREAWDRLMIAGRRFARGTLEATITGAKQALSELVKSKGGELLRSLIDLLS